MPRFSIWRLIAIGFIFGATSIAWFTLGGFTEHRTRKQGGELRGEVADLWGRPHRQRAPDFTFHWTTREVVEQTRTVNGKTAVVRKEVDKAHSDTLLPMSSRVDVGLGLDQRLKGLMWYALFDVDFAGDWVYEHRRDESGHIELGFQFPDAGGVYDRFSLKIDGEDRTAALTPEQGKVSLKVPVMAGQKIRLQIAYRSRGMDEWRYVPANGVSRLEDFNLSMRTDFADIDFPGDTMSPSSKARAEGGWAMEWAFDHVVTGRGIGMVMPQPIQPGELAGALSFSAPVSLFFFFLVMLALALLRGIDVNPMNYVFLAGAFFAFHLLFAYSVDHIGLVPAFVVASATSLVLVVSYLRLVVGARFAFVEAALAQLVYLVGFSLAHFWDGYTGLTITVLSILTLFLLMQWTGRVKWSELMQRRKTEGGSGAAGVAAPA